MEGSIVCLRGNKYSKHVMRIGRKLVTLILEVWEILEVFVFIIIWSTMLTPHPIPLPLLQLLLYYTHRKLP